MYDLAIIGGGPAGSILAGLVRRQDPDRRVVMLEAARHPRHHVGESSLANWGPILERAGMLDAVAALLPIRKAGVVFWWGTDAASTWTVDFRGDGGPPRPSWQVDRAAFDEALFRRAGALGAETLEGASVRGASPREGGGWRLDVVRDDGGSSVVEAAFVADASGQQRVLSRVLGLRAGAFDGTNNFAVYGYWRGSDVMQHGAPVAADERWTTIATSEDGWLWHIPITPDLVSVGLVTDGARLAEGRDDLRALVERNVRSSPPIARLLAHAALDRHPRAPRDLMVVRDWSYRAGQLAGGDWLLVGDAAAFVDPLLSSGLLLGAHGASMAANLLSTRWAQPTADAAALSAAYQEAYLDAALAYHRLVRTWYASNFVLSSWHWEAHRQALRSGTAPSVESAPSTLAGIALGAFIDPLAEEGAADPFRPDRIVAGARLGVREERVEIESERDARRESRRLAAGRWRAWLLAVPRLTGCHWRRRDTFATSARESKWRPVSFVEARADDATDAYDRSVLLPISETGRTVLEALDGVRTVRAAALATCEGLDATGAAFERAAGRIMEHVLHLHARGWLVAEPAARPEPDLSWLDRVATVLPGWHWQVDALGVVLSLRGPEGEVRIAPATWVRKPFRRLGELGLVYRGSTLPPELAARIDALVHVLAARPWPEAIADCALADGELARDDVP